MRPKLLIPAALATLVLIACAAGAAAAAPRHHGSYRRFHHAYVRHTRRHRRHRRRHSVRHVRRSHAAWRCAGADLLPGPGDIARVRHATFCLINRERFRHHLPTLRLNMLLAVAAEAHSESMARGGYFSHDGTRGETPLARIRATGYLAAHASFTIGENIAWGTLQLGTPRAIVASWMASPAHRANILYPLYRESAIGVASAEMDGQRGGIYTEDFGALGGHGRTQRSS